MGILRTENCSITKYFVELGIMNEIFELKE